MIEFSRSTNYPGSKVLYVLHYPLPYLKALKRKHISKIFQSNNRCNLPCKHLPAGCFFLNGASADVTIGSSFELQIRVYIGKHYKVYTGIELAEGEKRKQTNRD